MSSQIGSPTLLREIDRQLARVVLERDDLLRWLRVSWGLGAVSYGLFIASRRFLRFFRHAIVLG